MYLCYWKREHSVLPGLTLLCPFCILALALSWPHSKVIQFANPREQGEQGEKKESSKTQRKEIVFCWVSRVNQLLMYLEKYQSHCDRPVQPCCDKTRGEWVTEIPESVSLTSTYFQTYNYGNLLKRLCGFYLKVLGQAAFDILYD